MTTTISSNPLGVDDLVERVIHDTTTFSEYLSVWLGLELGLYASLDAGGPPPPSARRPCRHRRALRT